MLERGRCNAPAKFEVEAAAPFAVVPRSGFLEIGKSLQIDVSFFSKQTGSFESSLEFKYDSGEVVLVRAAGTSDNANIKLERSSLRMESTSITLISSKSVRIFNRSDIMVRAHPGHAL
nr:hypothetical protein HK105_006820 [Polyrhizophydium stewartii]